MAGLRQPASTRGERDASAGILDVVGLAARKDGWTASPSPALPLGSRQPRLQGCWRGPRRVQPTPSLPQRGLVDGGATVGQTREQLALFPHGVDGAARPAGSSASAHARHNGALSCLTSELDNESRRMAEMTEPYEVAVTGETYRVVPENNAEVRRICVHSGGQFRFSLPGDIPEGQVRTFIQVYALGLVDGQSARSSTAEDQIRGRLNRAARRLGQAI